MYLPWLWSPGDGLGILLNDVKAAKNAYGYGYGYGYGYYEEEKD